MIPNDLTSRQLEVVQAGPGQGPYARLRLYKHGLNWTALTATAVDYAAMGHDATHFYGIEQTSDTTINIYSWLGASASTASVSLLETPSSLSVGSVDSGDAYVYYNTTDVVRKVNLRTLVDTVAYTPISLPEFDIELQRVAAINDSEFFVSSTAADGVVVFGYYDGNAMNWSDVYWSYGCDYMTATTLAGRPVLCVSGSYVPYRAAQASGATVRWVYRTTTGVATFVWDGYDLTDHYEVIGCDSYYGRSCERAFLTNVNGLGVVIYSYSGYNLTRVTIQSSVDGRSWSLQQPLSLAEGGGTMGLAKVGDYIYCSVAGLVYRSECGLLFGQRGTYRDFSDELLSANLTSSGRMQAELALAYTESTVSFFDEEPMLAMLELGYYYGSEAIYTRALWGEVVEARVPEGPDFQGNATIDLTIQDFSSYLDRESLWSVEIPMLEAGFDPYTDFTEADTEYGGMAHTYAVERSWKTIRPSDASSNRRLTPSGGGRSVALSTYVSNALNGEVATWFSTTDAATEQAGVVYRALAGGVLTQALYNRQAGQCVVRSYNGERDSAGNAISYSIGSFAMSPGASGWFRAVVRYAKHTFWTSTDGVSWTLRATLLSQYGAIAGSFGVIAQSPDTSDNTSTSPWDGSGEPDFPSDIWEPPDYIGSSTIVAYLATTNGGVWYTENYYSPDDLGTMPTWVRVGDLTYCSRFAIDWIDTDYIYALTTASEPGGIAIWRSHKNEAWECILTKAEIETMIGAATSTIILDMTTDPTTGYLYIYAWNPPTQVDQKPLVEIRSTDHGETWSILNTTITTGLNACSTDGNAVRIGQTIWVAYGLSTATMVGASPNGWATGAFWSPTASNFKPKVQAAQLNGTNKAYAWHNSGRLYRLTLSGSSITAVPLLPQYTIPNRFDAYWQSELQNERARMLVGYNLYTTLDDWVNQEVCNISICEPVSLTTVPVEEDILSIACTPSPSKPYTVVLTLDDGKTIIDRGGAPYARLDHIDSFVNGSAQLQYDFSNYGLVDTITYEIEIVTGGSSSTYHWRSVVNGVPGAWSATSNCKLYWYEQWKEPVTGLKFRWNNHTLVQVGDLWAIHLVRNVGSIPGSVVTAAENGLLTFRKLVANDSGI